MCIRDSDYIAQPLEILSTTPTISEEGIEPRHLDLRPFVLTGKKSWVTTGGLTRVCLLYTSPSPRDKRQSRMPSSA